MDREHTTARTGIKTTELWVTVIAGILIAVWPDFPSESFFVLVGWATTRVISKISAPASGVKRAWMSSEFWLSILYAVGASLTELPTESLVAVLGWAGARAGIKIMDHKKKEG